MPLGSGFPIRLFCCGFGVSGWCFLDGLLSVSVLGFGVGWLLIADSWFSCE